VTSGGSAGAAVQRALDLLVADGAPGALAELRVGGRTWSLSAGFADLRTRSEVAASSRVRIGSVAKTFTATLVLQLVGEGRLGLDDTVERWLPGLVPDGHTVSVHQLLDHRSGLYNHTEGIGPADFVRDRFVAWRPRDVVAQAVSHPPAFAPGTDRRYCNTGYLVLGLIAEKASASRFEDELTRRIVLPLDLTYTAVGTTDAMADPYLHGYVPIGDELVDVSSCNSSLAWAAGGMVSTPADLNRFYSALLNGDLLGPTELSQMLTTCTTSNRDVDARLGVFVVRLPDGTAVWGKDGGFFGYHTWTFHTARAERQLTVSMSVAHNDRPSSHRIVNEVATAFVGG
jgi:D-alanyl-D-alanine carboxypeptidase